MYILLLFIIYLAFISLGLPDSLLGSAWPVMRLDLGAPLDFAGIVSMLIAGCTIISSLLSDRMNYRFGTGLVTAVSVGMTSAALFGFSASSSLWMLCLWAVPYGLGAGAVDAALNNYVALHYTSRHMSWLHCCWGVGASVSPYIMGHFISANSDWQGGYRAVGAMQLVLTVILFASLPLWKRQGEAAPEDEKKAPPLGLAKSLRIRGVPHVLTAFLCYCAVETTCGLWASSYLVEWRRISAQTAARFASLFYLGITIGRLLNGFISDRFGDRRMIRLGTLIMLAGTALVMLPLGTDSAALAGLVVIGLGCAPVYPCIIHSTPFNFGRENSQAIIGVQMASAYVGSTFMPPVFGAIGRNISMGLYPVFLAFFTLLLLLMTERLNKTCAGN